MPFVANRVFGWEPVEITPDWHLRDVNCGWAYPLCRTLSCRQCGLVFLDIRFDDAEIAALYRGYRDAAYVAQRVRFEPDYQARNDDLVVGHGYVRDIERFLRARIGEVASVLDWGGDTGINTPFRGHLAVHDVYDISEKPVVDGARRIRSADEVESEYDLIVLSQVLEHVPFPADTVAEVVRVLGPNTALWVEVPYEDVIREAADPSRAYLEKMHWHEHVNFFTEDALARLLGGQGLAVQDKLVLPVEVARRRACILGVLCGRSS